MLNSAEISNTIPEIKCIQDFLAEFFPQGTPGEFTIWESETKRATHFTAGDAESIEEAAAYCYELAQDKDVYFSIYPHINGLPVFGRGKEEHITMFNCIYADVDLDTEGNSKKKGKGIVLPPDIDTVMDMFVEFGLPECTLIANSGNGLHCYWLFDNPMVINNEQNRKDAKQICVEFSKVLSGFFTEKGYNIDALKDIARVLRVPYTYNYKAGRENRKPVELIKNSGKRCSISEIKDFIEKNRHRMKITTLPKKETLNIIPEASGLTGKNGGAIPEGTRNAKLASIAGGLRRQGLNIAAIEAALLSTNELECDPPLPEQEVINIAKSISRYSVGETGNFELNDTGNAKRLVSIHGENIRYSSEAGSWYQWNGKFWHECRDTDIVRLANDVLAQLRREANALGETALRYKELKNFAKISGNEQKIKSMINLAKAEPGISLSAEDFDRDNWLLNCANGTLNLKTGELQSHNKEDLLTKIIDVDYDPNAKCPKWENFMCEVMEGKQSLISFLQRIIGYSLTGDIREQCIFILEGAGANGKSTMIETIRSLLKPYVAQADFSTFQPTCPAPV